MNESTVRHSNPFWIDENHDFISSLQTHPRIIHAELATNNDEYDIVIIGTGLSGVSCAYWLRKLYPVERFPRILLLEKNARPCSGASGRNGGFLWPSYDYLAGYVEDVGYDNGCQWVEFQHENLRSIAEAVNENNIDCELNLTRGNVALARNNQELESIVKSYELVKDYINKHPKTKMSLDNLELWDHEKCQQMLHSDKFIGALFMHESGTVWVSKLVYGLLNYCLDQPGVDLLTQGKVIRIENSKNLILENGRVIIARQAIVHATNAYAVEYLDFLRNKIIPTRGQCSRSKPIETIFWPFGLSANNGREYYHQSPIDGRIMLGGCRWGSSDTEHNNQNDSEINELIREEHERFFSQWHPGIASKNHTIEIEQEWTGIMAFTIDHLPIIGPLPEDDKQFLLCGYNGKISTSDLFLKFRISFSLGNGMPNAFLCAKAIARMIANEDPYKEGEENNTVTFLKMFLPERFTNSTTQSSQKKRHDILFDYE
jgi:glycine/D-amino acid oxidase-like deaminating enzyme